MKLALNLEGDAADRVWRLLLEEYAKLVLKSRLDKIGRTINAPWRRMSYSRGMSEVNSYRRWMKDIDRERLAYKATLAEVFGGAVPEVPPMVLRESHEPDRDGWVVYARSDVDTIASNYARHHLPPVETAKKALGLK